MNYSQLSDIDTTFKYTLIKDVRIPSRVQTVLTETTGKIKLIVNSTGIRDEFVVFVDIFMNMYVKLINLYTIYTIYIILLQLIQYVYIIKIITTNIQ